MRRLMLVIVVAAVWMLAAGSPAVLAQQAGQEVVIERGTVVQVVGNTVIIRHDNGDVKRYVVPYDAKAKFAEGEKSVTDLRPGDVLTKTTIRPTSTATLTAEELKALPSAKPAAAASTNPAATPAGAAPAAKPAAAPAAASAPAAAPTPAALPKTASPLPLAGLAGLLFLASGLALRRRR